MSNILWKWYEMYKELLLELLKFKRVKVVRKFFWGEWYFAAFFFTFALSWASLILASCTVYCILFILLIIFPKFWALHAFHHYKLKIICCVLNYIFACFKFVISFQIINSKQELVWQRKGLNGVFHFVFPGRNLVIRSQ